jgi:TRAP-type C4-dicarboxylate transport system substrate-binding protein
MSGRSTRTFVCLGLGAALLGGCGAAQQAPAQDKAGAQTLVLKLATNDSVVGNGLLFGPEAFVHNLESVSGGMIKVDMTLGYGDGAADSETDLVKAIASGEVDGGWPSTRAFANAGVDGLEAVEAPLTITSYAASKALVSGPVAGDLLAQLKGTGIAGLGLAVGPLRRPFAAQAPLLGPADWQGVTFRSFNSPIQADTIKALGGTPVNAGSEWADEVAAGTLRGAEFDVVQYAVNGLGSQAPYVTANVVLWPKVFVLALSQRRYDALTDQQRAWVGQAAEAATKASVDATYDESTAAASLCDSGVRFIDATQSQLSGLHDAVSPVIEKIATDPLNGPLLAKIQAIAAQYPQIEEPDVPASCRDTAGIGPSPSIPATASSLPNGTYRMQVTQADAKRLGLLNNDGTTGTWTLTVKSGSFALSCRFIDQPDIDCGHSHADGATVEAGRLLGTGNTAFFVGDVDMLHKASGCLLPASATLDGHCNLIPPYWLDWSLTGAQLTFSNGGGDLDAQQYEIAPWTSIN